MQKIIAFSALLALTAALPQRNRGGRKQQAAQQQTAQQQAAQIPQGISQAQDGSTILDDTVMVKYISPTPLFLYRHQTNTRKAAYQSVSRYPHQQISSCRRREYQGQQQHRGTEHWERMSYYTVTGVSPSSTCRIRMFRRIQWA